MAFKFRSRLNYSDRAIRTMSRETREKLYRQEKDELFMQIRGLSAAEVQEAHDQLIQKWRI